MTLFWTLNGLMLVGLLALVIPPLLARPRSIEAPAVAEKTNVALHAQRSQGLQADLRAGHISDDDAVEAQAELDAELQAALTSHRSSARTRVGRAPSIVLAVFLCALVPLLSFVLYGLHGQPAGIDPALSTPPANRNTTGGGAPAGPTNQADVFAMVRGLEERLQREPGDAAGWRMLGRSYFAMERFTDAVTALTRAEQVLGEDSELLVEIAEAQAFAAGNNLQGEPRRRLERALALDGDMPKALWLGGFAALQAGETDMALARWQKLLGYMDAGSDEARTLATLIDGVKTGVRSSPNKVERAEPGLPQGPHVACLSEVGRAPRRTNRWLRSTLRDRQERPRPGDSTCRSTRSGRRLAHRSRAR